MLLILGGESKERKVSLSSGNACFKAIKKLGYSVKKFDPYKKNIHIIKDLKFDLIFNALHGKGGEDGVVQTYFECFKIPYTHSGVIPSINEMNKIISKKMFLKNQIRTPKFFSFNKNNIKLNEFKRLLKNNKIQLPIVIKPVDEGSSIGVKIFYSLNQIINHIRISLEKYNQLIVEEFIGGQEIQVAVMENKPIGAIELKPKRKFYDYKAKYSKAAMTNHIMPANISAKSYNTVLRIAKKAHTVLKCRGVSRSDFKFYKNKFYLLEINTQPGMTSLSLVPEIAKYKGISFEKLVKSIIKDAGINK